MKGMSKDRVAEFWNRVDKTDGCWEWLGARSRYGGYGSFRVNGRGHGAHRVAWELTHGKIRNGLCVCHKCDIPWCVRPEHLFLGTRSDNMQDHAVKGRFFVQSPLGRQVTVRYTDEQFQLIYQAAKAEGVTIPQFFLRAGIERANANPNTYTARLLADSRQEATQ